MNKLNNSKLVFTTNCVNHQIFTLYHNNICMGTIDYEVGSNWIGYLHINENHRNKGYGKFMINHVSNILKNEGHTYMQVNSTPSARGFYEKYGFKKCGGMFNRWYHGLDNSSEYYIKI